MGQYNAVKEDFKSESESLEEAFDNFNQATNYLTEFYKGLENQVSILNAELTSAKQEKNKELVEKKKLAERLANLLRVLPGGVIVLDGDGMINECNPAAIELLGEPLVGQLWRDIVERCFEPRWDDGHDITLRNGRCVNISTQSLELQPGQILLIKDVTETRRLQDQFSHLKRLSAMGEMAASLAHQVRTPLSSAILYASNLSRAGLDEKVRSRFNSKLLTRLQNLESLVEDMLLFARGGRFDSQVQPLHQLVSDIEDSIQSQFKEQTCELNIENSTSPATLEVNRNAMISSLQNLINNAIQSSTEQVKIDLRFRNDDKSLYIEIQDNGPGIPKNIQDRLFEPFFTTRSQGTGLGLAVVDAVVNAHGGKLSFDSTENVGTTFYLQIPLLKGVGDKLNETHGEKL